MHNHLPFPFNLDAGLDGYQPQFSGVGRIRDFEQSHLRQCIKFDEQDFLLLSTEDTSNFKGSVGDEVSVCLQGSISTWYPDRA